MNELELMTKNSMEQYKVAALDVAVYIILGRFTNNKLIIDKIFKAMQPKIDDMFTKGIAATNKLVKQDVAELAIKYNVPYKYNKDLLLKLNDKSIFTGYYDKVYKSLYSKTEINRLKNVILSAKYGGWDEKTTLRAIGKAVDMTNKKALLLARNETARLTSVANQIYFGKKEVRNKYDLIWFNSGSNIRPTHAAMAGKKADKNGMFKSGSGLVPGPPLSTDPYNCKCYSELVLKK